MPAALTHYRWLCRVLSPWTTASAQLTDWPQDEADWQAIIQLGSQHLILPALYCRLLQLGWLARLPAEVAAALQGFHELNQWHNQRLREQVLAINSTLAEVGITPVWLKGATHLLASDWRQRPRMMLDLDLWLTSPQALADGLAALEGSGYTVPPEYASLSDDGGHHLRRRMQAGRPAGIEIHRHLVSADAWHLLADAQAVNTLRSEHRAGQLFATLSQLDQCLHSYIQCTLMNGDGWALGKIKLMKVLDLLERLHALPADMAQTFWARLATPAAQADANSLRGYLQHFFAYPDADGCDLRLVRRVRSQLTPDRWQRRRCRLLVHELRKGAQRLRQHRLGPWYSWPGKALRLLQRLLADPGQY